MDANDLVFTAPVSLAREDIPAVKEILLKAIGDISKVVEKSDSEDVVYLGIDWLRIT
jgi:hypothetical protein